MPPDIARWIIVALCLGLVWSNWRARRQARELAAVRTRLVTAETQLAENRQTIAQLTDQQTELAAATKKKLHRARHDMIGCLNIVSGYRELLLMQAENLDERQREFLDRMGDGVRRSLEAADSLIADEKGQSEQPVATESQRGTAG